MKHSFTGLSLKEVMILLGQTDFQTWQIDAPPRPPSPFLQEALKRFDSFNLTNSEAAKVLLIDAIFIEVVPAFPKLRVWKAASLESDRLIGVADYLIAPKRAYLATPLLCAVEAKRDDFEQGRAQCLAEMAACRWNNEQENRAVDVYGVVSNGQSWQFYRLAQAGDVSESGVFTIHFLPELLGVLHYLCAACEQQIEDK
ncbi:MAG: hypothetical protein OHK0029_31200 [Armatimonadaceae bacterium]